MEKFQARKLMLWLMIFALLAGIVMPLPAVKAETLNGLVVPVQDEEGEPLTNGHIDLYEKQNPEIYDESLDSYYQDKYYHDTNLTYQHTIGSNGEAFIPSSYLLEGREYELVVSGRSEAGNDVFYHHTFKGRDVQGIDFSRSKLTKTTFTTSKTFNTGRLVLTSQTDDGTDRFQPYIIPSNTAGQYKTYISSNKQLAVSALLVDTSDGIGYYLGQKFTLNGQNELEVNVDSATVRITPPAGFDKSDVTINDSYGIVEDGNLKEYNVTKGLNADISFTVTKDTYRYSFERYVPNLQADLALQLGSSFTGNARTIYNGNYYPGSSTDILYAETDYKDEYGNHFYDYWPSYSAANVPSDSNAGLLNYELTDSSGNVKKFSTNSLSGFSLSGIKPGTYTLRLVNQNFSKNVVNLSLNKQITVNAFPDANDSEVKTISVEAPENYSNSYYWADLWEINENGNVNWKYVRGNQSSIGIYPSEIDSSKSYVLHISAWLTNNSTQAQVRYYTQLALTGEQLKSLTVIPAERNLVPVRPTLSQSPIKGSAELTINVPVAGTNQKYPFWSSAYKAADGTSSSTLLLLKPGQYGFSVAGSDGNGTAYQYYKEASIASSTNEVSVGFDDVKDQAVPVEVKENGSAVPFAGFYIYRGQEGVSGGFETYYDPRQTESVPVNKLVVTPGNNLYFTFKTVEKEEFETPWLYNWISEAKDISGAASLDLSGNKQLSLERFEQSEHEGITQIDLQPVLKKGEFNLSYAELLQPYNYRTSAVFDKRDYHVDYYKHKQVEATIKIINSSGQEVYAADKMYLSDTNKIEANLPDDTYKLTISLPVGPGKELTLEQPFSVPVTTTAAKPAVSLSQSNEGLLIQWTAAPGNDHYEVYAAEKGQPLQLIEASAKGPSYVYKNIQSGKSYQVKVVGVNRSGDKAESDVVEYTVPDFVATKLDVNTVDAVSRLGLLKIDGTIKIFLEGSHSQGDQGKAIVRYKEGGDKTAEVNLAFDATANHYTGVFKVTENMTEVNSVTGYITNAAGAKTAELQKELNKQVGATVSGKIIQGGNAVAGATLSVSSYLGSIKTDSAQDGTYKLEGVPAGNAKISVIINNETFYDVVKNFLLQSGQLKTQDVNVPIFKTVKIRLVEKGTNTPVTERLLVQLYSLENNSNDSIYKSGYINQDGYFITYTGETELKKLPADASYQIKVAGKGIYQDSALEVTLDPARDYVADPIKVEVEKKTKQTTQATIELQFLDGEPITKVDYFSLYSPSVSSAFGYEVGSRYGLNQTLTVSDRVYLPETSVTEGVYVRYGTLTVNNVVYSNDYKLYVQLNGYLTDAGTKQFDISASNAKFKVSVDAGAKVTGRLVSQGKAIANAYVSAYGGGSYVSAVTNAQGEFTLNGLAPNTTITVSVNATGYLPFKRNITANITTPLGDIELEAAHYIDGRVLDKDGKPLMHVSVSASSSATQQSGWARTDSSGYFKIRGLNAGDYTVTASKYGYPSVTTESNTANNPVTIILQSDGKGSFSGEGNSFTTSAVTVIPNKNVQYRLNYKNNGSTDESEVKLSVTLPEGVDYVDNSALLDGSSVQVDKSGKTLNVTVSSVKAGAEGAISFEALVKNTASGALIATAKINDSAAMAATVNVLFVTLNAPAQTAQKTLKVYGSAKPGSTIEIFAGNSRLAEVKAESRWWFADVTLPVTDAASPSEYTLVANVTDKDSSMTYSSEAVTVQYNPNIPKITDVTVTAGWNGDVKLNPYTGVATFAITEKTVLPVKVTFGEAVDEASISFLGKTYSLTKGTDGTKFSGSVPYGWSSYGEQVLTLTFKKGDLTITLPLMEIMVLIDPSGYVFEGSMDNRLEGVTAVVQQKDGSSWSNWNAELFGQVNPQTTDAEGRYGWDVIQGDWRVLFNKAGYKDYVSRIVQVPPAETMLNVPLVRTTNPKVVSVTPEAGSTNVSTAATFKVVFDRPVDEINMDSEIKLLQVTGTGETPVSGTITKQGLKGYKEDVSKGSAGLGDVNGQTGWFVPDENKKLSKEITFVPAVALLPGTTYKLVIGDSLLDYDGKTLEASSNYAFTTNSAAAEQPVKPRRGGGGGGYVPPAVNNTAEVSLDKFKVAQLLKGTNVEIELDSSVSAVSFSNDAWKEAASKGYGIKVIKQGIEISASAKSFALKDNESLKLSISPVEVQLDSGYKKAGAAAAVSFVKVAYGQEEKITASEPVTVALPVDANIDSSLVGLYTEVDGNLVYKGRNLNAKLYTSSTVATLVFERDFSDLKTHWAANDVNYLVSHHVIDGVTETSFAPGETTTRAQVAKLLAELLQLDAAKEASTFKDVEQGAWYASSVAAVEKAGIFQGANGAFRPNDNISRQELAVVLSRLLKKQGQSAELKFNDQGAIAAWAKDGVAAAVQSGIIQGNEQQQFLPDANATRAEAAAMIRRLVKVLDQQ